MRNLKIDLPLTYISFLIGISLCLYLRESHDLSAVMASALVGLFASMLPSFLPSVVPTGKIKNIIYCGTFIAMGLEKNLSHSLEVFIAALFGTVCFLFMDKRIDGHGGKLGTIAFISFSILMFYRSVLWN